MRPGISIILSPADRRRLEALVGDRNVAQKHVWRARIVLHSADGIGTNGIMRRTGKSKTCVWRWQERFAQEGYDGLLRDKTRPSRIPPLGPEVAERVVALTLSDPPAEATHWVAAMMAKATGISVSSVQRIWRAHGLRPHRVRQFKLSNDPDFVAKLRDVVGLYVDPPAHAIVLSVDEKSQIQALDRTQPGLPMKKGRLGTMTHDYKRHGTTTLFAALNVLEGKVIGRCMQRHRHQEFIRFLNAIEADIPAGKGVHVILDNYAAHKHAKVRAWLGRHERFTFHFVPTSCSWLNAVEGFFAKLSTAPETRRLPLHCRPPGRHQPLARRDQRQPKALHLDRRSRQNHRRRQTRASSVRFDPLENQCGLSRERPIPGRFVTHHDGAFDYWGDLADEGTIGIDLVHVDAHSDLGLGDASWVYIMEVLLRLPVKERRDPLRGGIKGLSLENYIAFAVACR